MLAAERQLLAADLAATSRENKRLTDAKRALDTAFGKLATK
jgi:hypothetical protein